MRFRRGLLFHTVVITTVFLFADRFTKQLFRTNDFQTTFLNPRILRFVQHENYGIIANIPIPRVVTIVITIFFLALILRLLARSVENGAGREVVFLSILLAGAIGNLWDRIVQGYVFDWILLFGKSAINFADIFIVVGLFGFLKLTKRGKTEPRV